MAPVDIIIDIIKRHRDEAKRENDNYPDGTNPKYVSLGKVEAFEELLREFEGFKRLFN